MVGMERRGWIPFCEQMPRPDEIFRYRTDSSEQSGYVDDNGKLYLWDGTEEKNNPVCWWCKAADNTDPSALEDRSA